MRTAWIDADGDVHLYLGNIWFWTVRGNSEKLKKWWESGEMPFPSTKGTDKIR